MTKRGVVSHPGPPVKRGPYPDGPRKRDGIDDGVLDVIPEHVSGIHSENDQVDWVEKSFKVIESIDKMSVSLEKRFTHEKAYGYSNRCREIFHETCCLIQDGRFDMIQRYMRACENLLIIMVRKGAYAFSCEHVEYVVRCLYILNEKGYIGLRRHWKRLERLADAESRSRC